MEFTLAWQNEKLDVLRELRSAIDSTIYTQFSMEQGVMLLNVETEEHVDEHEIARAIAKTIAGTVQTNAIGNISKRALWQLTPGELRTVNMLTQVRASQKGLSASHDEYITRIAWRVADCLNRGPLHLEGFLCFRMRDFVQAWARCMDEVVCRAIEEYEYVEYIELLKQILLTQRRTEECVYIMPVDDGQGFKLKAGDGLSILDGNSEFANRRGLTAEDELICSLLIKAPAQIIIIGSEVMPGGALETILRVFEGRVQLAEAAPYSY